MLARVPFVLLCLASNAAAAADTCPVQATQWLQDGPILGAEDGPAVARATSSPELLAVEVELVGEPAVARLHLVDSVATVDGWMSFEGLRLRARRPLSFADDTLYTGSADLRAKAVEATGIKVAPFALPDWIEISATASATVACDDLDLVESWPGDLRPLAVGSTDRGERVYLRAGTHVEVSRIPGTSPALTLHPKHQMPVEAVSKDGSAVRIIARFDGGLVVGWVEPDAVSDSPAEDGGAPDGAVEGPAEVATDGEVLVCKKGAPLWATASGQDFILGTLEPGSGVILGDRSEDRVPVLAVPSATAWGPVEGATWWLDAKAARGCK
jgi:hypothetical protein